MGLAQVAGSVMLAKHGTTLPRRPPSVKARGHRGGGHTAEIDHANAVQGKKILVFSHNPSGF